MGQSCTFVYLSGTSEAVNLHCIKHHRLALYLHSDFSAWDLYSDTLMCRSETLPYFSQTKHAAMLVRSTHCPTKTFCASLSPQEDFACCHVCSMCLSPPAQGGQTHTHRSVTVFVYKRVFMLCAGRCFEPKKRPRIN